MLRKRFAVAKKRTAKSARRAKRGSAFLFTLSENARTSIAIARALPGRRSGKRCVKPRKGLKRRCTRYMVVSTLTRTKTKQGANRIAFSGRIGRASSSRAATARRWAPSTPRATARSPGGSASAWSGAEPRGEARAALERELAALLGDRQRAGDRRRPVARRVGGGQRHAVAAARQGLDAQLHAVERPPRWSPEPS